jgi:hypothetical protein
MAELPDVERSLHLARQVFSPSDEQRARVRSALGARVPASTLASLAGDAATSGRALLQSSRVAGAAKAALLVGAGFAFGYWFAETRHAEVGVLTTERAASASDSERISSAQQVSDLGSGSMSEAAPQTSSGAVASGVVATPRASASGGASASSLASASNGSTGEGERSGAGSRSASKPLRAHASRAASAEASPGFVEELALLARAERSIRAGNAPLARSFIAELEQRFPKTALRQERAALLVLAACATHEPTAPREAREFLARHEHSVYVDRIRSMCPVPTSTR